ncbi:hypothetical protein ACFT43_06495 [Streptomyces albidoflavus]
MADYRAEAIEVYETTRSSDTRGIIAALLYLAEGGAPEGPPRPRDGDEGRVWRNSALRYLQDRPHRSKTADRVRDHLVGEGFDIDLDAVKRFLWSLVEEGLVQVNTNSDPTTFMAAPKQR